MLLNLRIRDFAIIDAVELELPTGFTVVTGETGAGKSILVDALTVAMGGRASADLVRTGAETAEVEALFDISDHPVVKARLEQRELVGDDPDTLLIRRVVGARGRAKVVINGRLSTVATLSELVRGLVDISGQHEQQSLLVVENHLEILDAYAALDPLKSSYRAAYDALRALTREQARLQASEEDDLRRADFLRFQLDEIVRVSPVPGEDVGLGGERDRLTHAEKLRHGATVGEALLYGEDGSAFDKIGKACAEIEDLASIDAELHGSCDMLAEARRQIEEVARFLQRYANRV
ncbi:MAG TPA: AAA family ATPase, partial [Myxococcota bacterium]|nr:AAA family ATPase [Myxococcota bacterium]